MKHILVRGVSLAAVMLAVPAPVLAAAGAAEAKAESANEIIVSARKREENVQDVPISITAISGEALERKGAVNFESLSFNNPNVKIATQSGVGPIAANIAIRGNIQSAGTLQVDPSVGVYVDGLLLAHTFGTAQLGVDVMSVQTLKGPQGTLFGRNTTGGAMLIRTRDPELGEVSGYVQGSYGELDTWRAGGAINIPVSEIAALRLVYQRNHSDDYEFFTDGRSLGRKDEEVLRAKLLVEPAPGTRLLLTAEKLNESGTSTAFVTVQPNRPVYRNVPVSPFPTAVGQGNVVPFDPRAKGHLARIDAQFYGAQIRQEIGNGAIQFMAGRRVYHIHSALTLPPQFGYTYQDKPRNKDTSLELQYTGQPFGDVLDLAAGLYYFKETVNEAQNTFLYSGVQRTSRDLLARTESRSAYLQATWHATDALNLTGGLRYTDDDKNARLLSATVSGTTLGTPEAALLNPPATFAQRSKKVNYLVSADYSFGDDFMVYASHATGYRAGGPSVDRVADNQPANPGYLRTGEFTPENVKNYEIGFKSEPLPGVLTINGAAFLQDYSNYQYLTIVNATRILRNTDARIKGFELDGRLRLGSGTTISADVGLTDAKVDDSTNASDGQALPYISRWTWGVTFNQTVNLGSGAIDFVANYSWRDRWWSVIEDPTQAASPAEPSEKAVSNIRAIGLLNLSLGYTSGPWNVAVFANNATNEKSYTYLTYSSAGAINYGGLGMPRVIGVRSRFNF